jgi:hypothetical protein
VALKERELIDAMMEGVRLERQNTIEYLKDEINVNRRLLGFEPIEWEASNDTEGKD